MKQESIEKVRRLIASQVATALEHSHPHVGAVVVAFASDVAAPLLAEIERLNRVVDQVVSLGGIYLREDGVFRNADREDGVGGAPYPNDPTAADGLADLAAELRARAERAEVEGE